MATLRRVAVATADPGGYDAQYTSLANALAGESKDLVTLDRQLLIECYPMTDTSLADFGGFVTDATRYITVRGAAGAEANAVWRTSGVYRIRRSALNAQGAVNLNAAYTRLERIQVENTSTFGNRGAIYVADQPGMVCDGVFVKGAGTAGSGWLFAAGTNAASNTIRNCIAWNCGDTGFGGGTGLSGLTNNNTAVACGVGFTTSSTGPVNCVAFGCTTGFTGAPSAPSNNASGDATAPGPNSLTGIADPFTNSATGDFSLVAGSALIDGGANLSAQGVTTDIAGTARPQGSAYDIGASEYSAGAPSEVTATGAGTLPALTTASAAEVTDTAAGVALLPALLASGATDVAVGAIGGGMLPGLLMAGAAHVESAAVGMITLPALQGSGEVGGIPAAQVSGAAVLPAIAGSAAASVAVEGGAAAALPALASSGAVRLDVGALGGATLPAVRAAGGVVVEITGIGAGLLPMLAIASTAFNGTTIPLQIIEFEVRFARRLEFTARV